MNKRLILIMNMEADTFLKHRPIIGHVEHKLYLILLFKLGGWSVILPIDFHLSSFSLDLFAGPWLKWNEMVNLHEKIDLKFLLLHFFYLWEGPSFSSNFTIDNFYHNHLEAFCFLLFLDKYTNTDIQF